MTLNNRAIRLTEIALLPGEDRRGRLREALQCAYTAFALFEQIGHAPYASAAAAALSFISQELSEFFGEVRAGAPLEWALPQAQLAALPAELREVCLEFVRARNQAEATKSAAAWQAAALTGRQLLESPAVARLETPAGTRVPSGSESEFELEPIRIETANCWNQLGCLLGGEQKYAEAVTALSEAIRLRPEEVILHCNRAKANLDLGNLAAAAADLARAAELDPDHPLLAALREELANKKDTDGRI